MNWHKVLLISVLFSVVNFSTSSSLVHEVYWLVSSYVYLYSWIFWFLWLGFFILFVQKRQSRYLLISNILFFCSMGINEMFFALNISSIALLIFIGVKYYKIKFSIFIPSLLIAVVASWLFLSSPGITQRFNMLNESSKTFLDYFTILKISLKDYTYEFLRILFNPLPIGTFILCIAVFSKISLPIPKSFSKEIFFLVVLFTIILYLMTWAYYFTMADAEEYTFPVRIFTSINTGVLILFVFCAFYLSGIFQTIVSKYSFSISLIAICFLAYGLIFSKNNLYTIRSEYKSGLLSDYKNEVEEMHKTILNAAKNDNCWKLAIVKDLENRPTSIFSKPVIEPNRLFPFWNEAYESFFQINEIRLEGDTIYKFQMK